MPQVEPTGGKGTGARASRQRVEPTSGPTAQKKAAPNSAQRRSARRLQKFLEAKQGSGPAKAAAQSPPVEPQGKEPASVEPDERADAEMTETTGDEQRGRKRAAGEAPACTHPPPPQYAAARHEQQQRPQPAGIGGRGRDGPGLKPPTPADRRRDRAALALEERREGGRG